MGEREEGRIRKQIFMNHCGGWHMRSYDPPFVPYKAIRADYTSEPVMSALSI